MASFDANRRAECLATDMMLIVCNIRMRRIGMVPGTNTVGLAQLHRYEKIVLLALLLITHQGISESVRYYSPCGVTCCLRNRLGLQSVSNQLLDPDRSL